MGTEIHTTRLRKLKRAMGVLTCSLCLQVLLIPNPGGPRLDATPQGAAGLLSFSAVATEGSREGELLRETPIRTSLARLPLHFEENRGQAEGRFDFISRAGGYALLLAQGEAMLVLNDVQRSDLGLPDRKSDGSSAVPERPQSQVRNTKQSVLRMKLIGANTSARILGLEPLAVKSNYFIGNDPKKWRTDVPSYARVKYEDVYPGVDLIFYRNQSQLEYDFKVAPGASPEVIRLAFDGADAVRIDPSGHLMLETPAGRVSVRGKDLLVQGEFFDPDAVVLLNGKVRKTTPDLSSPTSTLIASKAGKKIKPGKAVVIEVRNSNGEASEPFLFAPSGPGIASRGLLIEESRVAGLHACLPSSRSKGSKPAIGNPGSAASHTKLSGATRSPQLSDSRSLVP